MPTDGLPSAPARASSPAFSTGPSTEAPPNVDALVRLDEVARAVVRDHAASPAAVVAGSLGAARGIGSAGTLTWEPGASPVDDTTPFDLASVTKPFVALAFARLVRLGVFGRDERLADVVPKLAGTHAGGVSLDLLSAHRSGLEAHQHLYAPLVEGSVFDRERAFVTAASACRTGCEGAPPADGFAPVYSDMGYLLLGLALETRVGRPLDDIVHEQVLAPLALAGRVGSARQLLASCPRFLDRVAPTEVIAFRGGLVRGVVHDENAYAFTGDGLSGHAGLFGEASAVLDLGIAILSALDGRSSWLDASDLEPVLRRRAGGSLLAGFDAKSGDAPSAGARLGPRTFGHLGFTGTSLWIDPDQAFVGVLLTNRVHPTRDHIAIRAARPATYDAMVDVLRGTRSETNADTTDRLVK